MGGLREVRVYGYITDDTPFTFLHIGTIHYTLSHTY